MPRKLNEMSGMPQMQAAFAGWTIRITLQKVTQINTNGFITDSEPQNISFMGVIQPLSPRVIALKPDGQRSWTWLQIHVTSGPLDLTDNDRITYNQKQFKIMGKWDYRLDGYIEYHAVEDYQP